MKDDKSKVGRRDFLRASAGLVVAAAAPLGTEAHATETPKEERKPRYQANSPDVKNFYRVNSYPKKK